MALAKEAGTRMKDVEVADSHLEMVKKHQGESGDIASIYGAAGSIILILVWVYYSSIILYFGAEFTKVYAKIHGKKIIPKAYSIQIKKYHL